MASNLFDEDVVCRTHRGAVQFGLVLRNYEGYSSLEDSDDEEDTIKKGHVRVAWYPKGREEVVPENKVVLYDRSVMPGDAVRRMSPNSTEDTQRGIVRSVNVSCHVQSIRTKQMIYEVPSRDLTQLLVFQPGGHCVLGSWIGVVRNVFVRVIVRLKNGSRCALSDEGASRLTDVHDTSEEDSVFSYQDGFYPGQVLRGPACAFKNASWLSGTQPILSSRAYFKVTVEEVNVVGLDVHWQTRGLCQSMCDIDGKIKDEEMQPPARKVPEANLTKVKPLNYFVAASIQIGDKAMYTIRSEDLKYPQPVPRGSAGCFAKPAAQPESVQTNFMNNTNELEKQNVPESQGIVLQMEKTGDGLSQRQENTYDVHVNLEHSVESEVDSAKSHSDVNICKGASVDADDQAMGSSFTGIKVQSQEGVMVEDTQARSDTTSDGTIARAAALNENSTGVKIEQCDTDSNIAKDLSKDGTSHQVNSSQDKVKSNEMKQETDDSGVNKPPNETQDTNEMKLLKHAKEVQGDSKALQDKAVKFQTGLVRDVDLLTALHRDLCEASESIVKIADSFKPLLHRASNESAKEISSHVTRLLESRERLNEQINLTEGLLKGGKKTIGVLQHLADNKKSKSGRVDCDSSSDDYVSDDEDDAGSQTGSIGSIGSNASGKGSTTRSRPKVVSSRLLRHNRNQQPRMLTKKRPPPQPLAVCERICTEVTHTWTLVDVMWQDGSQEKSIVSGDLFPAHQLDELEFFPGDFVTKNNEDIENIYGLVCKADHKERTCLIQWIRRPNQHNTLPEKIDKEEVSVYDLTPHPDFTFNVGDVVVRIATSQEANTPQEDEEEQQACAGQVRWVNTDGTIHVAWVDSTESSVLPQNLYKLEEVSDIVISVPPLALCWDNTDGTIHVAWVDSTESSMLPQHLYKLEEDSDSDWSDYGNDDEEWEELNGPLKKDKSGSKCESDSSWETASSASTECSATYGGEDTGDGKSDGTKSTSISIEDAAKEDEDRMKSVSPSQNEKQQSDMEELTSECTDTPAAAATEEAGGATAAPSSDEEIVFKVPNIPPQASSGKVLDTVVMEELAQLNAIETKIDNIQVDTVVAEETLAQLSDIEDKMNQLCSAANSLLKRKRFLTTSTDKDGKKEKLGDEVAEDVARNGIEDTSDVIPETDDALLNVVSPSPDDDDEASGKTKKDVTNVCDINSPPMEGVLDSIEPQRRKESAIDNAMMELVKITEITDELQNTGTFILMEEVPKTHHFKSATFTPEDSKTFLTSIRKEMKLLQTSLPQGIIVKGYSDRMDLFSVLFEGPANTPYEDGLFFFDVRLPPDYPRSPPLMHYHAYCTGRLNPNLYSDGKVCVSLLGTWTGKGNEMWTSKSNLLQVLVSIQGLILVSEPYYNEAGYEKHRGSQQGLENSRMYNETAALKLIQSMQMMVSNPPEIFREKTLQFCRKHAYRMIHRVDHWLSCSNPSTQLSSTSSSSSGISSSPVEVSSSSPPTADASSSTIAAAADDKAASADVPFPLFPLSRGFLLSAKQALRAYRASLHVSGIEES